LLRVDLRAEHLRLLAEFTLALVLFTEAATANIAVVRQNRATIRRLLCVGLPLTIVLGWGVGAMPFRSLNVIEPGILATMLAPVDAALGLAVVSNPAVPAAIRENLKVESGLNDGICVPVLFVLLALATEASGNTRA
jgi:sodium/hydrogen antiporter